MPGGRGNGVMLLIFSCIYLVMRDDGITDWVISLFALLFFASQAAMYFFVILG